MAYKHGKNGQVTVGSSPFLMKITGWNTDDASELADSTDTSDAGYKKYTSGLVGVDWNIDAQFDNSACPFDVAAGGLVPGAIVSNMKLYTDVAGAGVPAYILPLAIIEKAAIKSVVNGVITWAISGKNQGIFSRPVGS